MRSNINEFGKWLKAFSKRLRGPPGALVAVFPEMLDDKWNVIAVTNPGFGVSEPKTAGKLAYQGLCMGHEFILG